jgi:Bifunctional DNA primase/polymerase, N-terminal
MTDATFHQALVYARRGWPVFPCLPGQKIPATTHGYKDATTDEQQITAWFGHGQRWNLAIATGTLGPDVLDIDQHGPAGNGYLAYARLRRGGLVNGAAAYVRTPAGGMHAYFTGTGQHNGRLPSHHLDFRSQGGYILAPPSQVGGNPYRLISRPGPITASHRGRPAPTACPRTAPSQTCPSTSGSSATASPPPTPRAAPSTTSPPGGWPSG